MIGFKTHLKKIFNKKQKCINCNNILKRKVSFKKILTLCGRSYDFNNYFYVCNKCNYKLLDSMEYFFPKMKTSHTITIYYPKDSDNIILHFSLKDYSTTYMLGIYKFDCLPLSHKETVKQYILRHIKAQKFKIFI